MTDAAYTEKLPRPTNRDSKKMLQKACNRLALTPVVSAIATHSCTFCGCQIRRGDIYRNAGYALKAHEECFKAVNREFNK